MMTSFPANLFSRTEKAMLNLTADPTEEPTVRILGVDFTSRPTRKKPITACWANLNGTVLAINSLIAIENWESFDSLLATPGPWIGGFDLPFGQPTEFLDSLGFQRDYRQLIETTGALSREEWVAQCRSFRSADGRRELQRETDKKAKATSPMKCYFTPVARMFHAGMPPILASGASIPAHQIEGDARIALEVYPALVAEALADSRSYKTDSIRKIRAEHRPRRNQIAESLTKENPYELKVTNIPPGITESPGADELDSILATLAAAWASTQPNWGIPEGIDPQEGWICDPKTQG
jgi:hypothetical protein